MEALGVPRRAGKEPLEESARKFEARKLRRGGFRGRFDPTRGGLRRPWLPPPPPPPFFPPPRPPRPPPPPPPPAPAGPGGPRTGRARARPEAAPASPGARGSPPGTAPSGN